MKTPTKEMGIVMTRPEATSGEATPIDPCVTARGYSHRCERGTFGCDRMHLPPEAVTIATLRAEVARLTAELAAARASEKVARDGFDQLCEKHMRLTDREAELVAALKVAADYIECPRWNEGAEPCGQCSGCAALATVRAALAGKGGP